LGEAALLAGVLPAPEHLSPFRNPDGALRARSAVLQRMVSEGYIREDEAVRVTRRGMPESMAHVVVPNLEQANFDSPTRSGTPFRAPFFVAEVLYQLREVLSDNTTLSKGGLHIHTTLDLSLQERAEQILLEDGKTMRLGEDKGEAALVAMEPSTGAVRVLVGGRSYAKSPYNRAMLARRQPGSAFKPVVYLAALATGLATPKTVVEDEEVVFKRQKGSSAHGASAGGASEWVAISTKEKDKLRVEARKSRALEKQRVLERIQKLKEEDQKRLKSHQEKKNQVKKNLQAMQEKLVQYDATLDSVEAEGGGGQGKDRKRSTRRRERERDQKLGSILREVSNLEEALWELEESEPVPGEELTELQETLEKYHAMEERQRQRQAMHGLNGSGFDDGFSESDDSDSENDYKPQNYSRRYRGVVTLRQSLSDSLNVPTVKLANLIGIDSVISMARKLGLKGKLPANLSLSLGSCEVSPFEMTHAFNTIAAGGVCSKPHFITRVKDSSNKLLYRNKSSKKVVVAPHCCAEMHSMLRSAVTSGTGRAAAKGWPAVAAAGKTGTSDDYRDAWFAGYTPSLTCVVWVGRDDNSSLPGTGSTLAAPLWARFMRAAQGSGIPTEKGTSKRKVAKWRAV